MLNKLREILGVAPQQKALPMRQQARPMMQKKEQKKQYILPGGGRSQFNPDSVQTVANLNPPTEDGYDSTIKYLVGFNQSGRNPMPMDEIPTNFTRNRTGYFQGSNTQPRFVNPQYGLSGMEVQSPELDRYLNRY